MTKDIEQQNAIAKGPTPANDGKVPVQDIELNLRFAISFASLWLLGLVASLATASLSTALSDIAKALQLSSSQTFWIPTAGTLASTLFQPGCALLANLIGRKMSLVFSGVTFVIGTVFAASANRFSSMLVGNCLRGIGIGSIISITDILVTDMVPLRFRGKWLSYLSISWACGISAGPLIGGALANASKWRWLFLMNIPTCLVGVVLATLTLPDMPAKKDKTKSLRHLDCPGLMLLTLSTASVIIPIMQAQVTYTWTDWQTLLPFILGFFGITAFLLYEQYVAVEPVIPLASFKNRSCLISFACITIHSITLWCLLFYLPLYYEFVRGYDTLKTGLAALPETIPLALVSLIMGILISRTGSYRWSIWVGWLVTILGYGLLYLLDANTTTAAWIGINLVVGLGGGLLFSSLTFGIQAPVPEQHVATAVTLQTWFRSLGSTFGIAIGSTIFRNQLKIELRSNSLLTAYVGSLRYIWITITALSVFAFLMSLAIPSHSLDRYEDMVEKVEES